MTTTLRDMVSGSKPWVMRASASCYRGKEALNALALATSSLQSSYLRTCSASVLAVFLLGVVGLYVQAASDVRVLHPIFLYGL